MLIYITHATRGCVGVLVTAACVAGVYPVGVHLVVYERANKCACTLIHEAVSLFTNETHSCRTNTHEPSGKFVQ